MSINLKANGIVTIKNINGTSVFQDNNCGSWINHWKKYGGNSESPVCCVLTCSKDASVGAHVNIRDYQNQEYFIVPMCDEHNGKHGRELDVKPGTIFVRANKSETCDKK